MKIFNFKKNKIKKDMKKLQSYLEDKEEYILNEKELRLEFISWTDSFEETYNNTFDKEEKRILIEDFRLSLSDWLNYLRNILKKDPNFYFYRMDLFAVLNFEILSLMNILYKLTRSNDDRVIKNLILKIKLKSNKIIDFYKKFREESQISILLKSKINSKREY